MAIRCAKETSLAVSNLGEVTYNLQEASVTDLSAWLSELSCGAGGEKSLEETWPSLVRGLRRRLETVRGAGSVPSLHFKHINNNGGHLPAATLDKVGTNIALFILTEYFFMSQLRRRGVIVIKAVLDGRTVTEMESELQKHLLDTAGPHHGLEPDIFW